MSREGGFAEAAEEGEEEKQQQPELWKVNTLVRIRYLEVLTRRRAEALSGREKRDAESE
jgi:hypothetical protein